MCNYNGNFWQLLAWKENSLVFRCVALEHAQLFFFFFFKYHFLCTAPVLPLHKFLITDEGLTARWRELVHGCDPPNNWGLERWRPRSPSATRVGFPSEKSENLGPPLAAVFMGSSNIHTQIISDVSVDWWGGGSQNKDVLQKLNY